MVGGRVLLKTTPTVVEVVLAREVMLPPTPLPSGDCAGVTVGNPLMASRSVAVGEVFGLSEAGRGGRARASPSATGRLLDDDGRVHQARCGT